jgi:hypothetical protein
MEIAGWLVSDEDRHLEDRERNGTIPAQYLRGNDCENFLACVSRVESLGSNMSELADPIPHF